MPIYYEHITAICCSSGASTGRQAEARDAQRLARVWAQLLGRLDDASFHSHFGMLPQAVVSKTKSTAFVAGVTRHFCFELALSDDLVLSRPGVDENGCSWLCPDSRHRYAPPGGKLGAYLKAMLPPPNGQATYKGVAVADLPPEVSAASIRKSDRHAVRGNDHGSPCACERTRPRQRVGSL